MRISAKALRTVSIDQFENWARAGLIVGDSRARRSYYSLETRSSNEALRASDQSGVTLDSVQQLLRLYVEALTGAGCRNHAVGGGSDRIANRRRSDDLLTDRCRRV
jgi:hypothetical protein